MFRWRTYLVSALAIVEEVFGFDTSDEYRAGITLPQTRSLLLAFSDHVARAHLLYPYGLRVAYLMNFWQSLNEYLRNGPEPYLCYGHETEESFLASIKKERKLPFYELVSITREHICILHRNIVAAKIRSDLIAS